METLSEVRKRLVSPPLTSNQISVTEIPRMVYHSFSNKRIGEEQESIVDGEKRLWIELPTINPKEKVILIFTEEFDDDTVRTKVGLIPWYPSKHEPRQQYDFEIIASTKSQGWSFGVGNKFIECISLKTRCVNIFLVPMDHQISDYIAEMIFETRRIIIQYGERIVYREFVDGAQRPPR